MSAAITRLLTGSGLTVRALRSSVITMGGYGLGQALRLASNLVLTRILYPEAFGVMALVTVFIVALNMFSDTGTGSAIMQSPRGDDPDFLDTAWVIQIGRGFLLWAVAAMGAVPFARLYGAPELAQLLPVAALQLIILGFQPTRLFTAHRHLLAGRVTSIELATQAVGIAVAVGLAFWLRSVWALVFSGLFSAAAQLVFLHLFLDGHRNRFRWDRSAAGDLLAYGRWIFPATVCGFVTMQADKVVLGHYLDLAHFGIYNIGYFLASFPMLVSGVVMWRLVIPIYRESPPALSRSNFLRIRRMRMAATGMMVILVALLALGGVRIVEFLYDPRYHAAAGVTVVLAVMQIPAIIIQSCDQAALAAGDSRRFFVLTLARAVFMVVFLVAGLQIDGLVGAMIGVGLAGIAAYPVLVWLLRPYGAWDPVHDGLFFALMIVIGLVAWELNGAAIAEIAGMEAIGHGP